MNLDDLTDTLNDLIETCKDGEYGFRSSAEHVRSRATRAELLQHAEECRRAAAELQDCVAQYGGRPEHSGTAAGAIHRGWVAVKSKLARYDDETILADTERGEDIALARYLNALEADLPGDVRALVERQALGLRRNQEHVHMLREQAHATRV
ncbi:MAG: PA2169 family four-helix-bundle protein [Burkholderiales bacterium]|nr:PA2169 family four-helix-bundle protein [Burkholderiales bacterium]